VHRSGWTERTDKHDPAGETPCGSSHYLGKGRGLNLPSAQEESIECPTRGGNHLDLPARLPLSHARDHQRGLLRQDVAPALMMATADFRISETHVLQRDPGLAARNLAKLQRDAAALACVRRAPSPSISMSSVECPSHVTRSPDEGRVSQNGSGFTSGNGVEGIRSSLGQRNSRIVGRSTPALSPDDTG
jgi:hypothetical protein